MFPNINLKRDLEDPTELPSKQIKNFKAPIFFLLPTEVEKAANLACETQNKAAVDFLKNIQTQNLREEKKIIKNRLIEEAIDRHLGLTMVKITEQLSSLVKNYFSSEIYKEVQKTKPNSLERPHSSELRLVIEAGNLAQLKRRIETQVKAILNIFKLFKFIQAQQSFFRIVRSKISVLF